MLNLFSGLLYPTSLYIHSVNFREFDTETPTKDIIYLKIIIVYSGTICNLVLYFLSHL